MIAVALCTTCGHGADLPHKRWCDDVTAAFELAAVLCGHDPSTATGAEDARHDFHVHDLVNGDRPMFDTTFVDDPGVTLCVRDASGLHFFGCGCPDEPPVEDDFDTKCVTRQPR